MWSPSRRGARPRAVALAAAGGLAFALSACGFQPMYAERAEPGSGQISPDVRNSVAIAPISDRIGQQLHNALRDRLNPRGQPVDPAYRLRVRVTSATEPSTLRSDGTATRRSFRLSASWTLEDAASSERVFTSTASASSSYNVADQPYATVAAFRDAQARVVDLVARDIGARVAGVLTAKPGGDRANAEP